MKEEALYDKEMTEQRSRETNRWERQGRGTGRILETITKKKTKRTWKKVNQRQPDERAGSWVIMDVEK